MGFPIDRELAGDVNNPSLELLDYVLRKQAKNKQHFDKLDRYYNGKHDVLNRQLNENSKNTKIVINHAKYVTDMAVGFVTGNPFSYTAAPDKNIKAIQDSFDAMDIVSHDTELEKDLSVFGVAYELLYLKAIDDTTTEERIESIDPRGVVLVTDDSVEKNPLFGIHYQKKFDLNGRENGYLVKVYTAKGVLSYRTVSGLRMITGNVGKPKYKEHYFGGVPIIEYRNNEEKQGDFEQAIPLIDAYNILQSDRVSDKEAFIDALLVVYGFTIQGKLKNGMIEAPGKGSDGAAVEWLTKQFDESQLQVLIKSLQDDIHKITYVPNLNDEQFAGNISGEAMKYKLFGLLNLMSMKSRYLVKGLRRRLELMQNIMLIKSQDVDVKGTKIDITPNIPVNLTDIINNIRNADGFIPREITVSWLPGVDDPAEVVRMLEKQKAADIAQNQKALGQPSNSDLDDKPDDKGGYRDDQGDVSTKQKQPDNELSD